MKTGGLEFVPLRSITAHLFALGHWIGAGRECDPIDMIDLRGGGQIEDGLAGEFQILRGF